MLNLRLRSNGQVADWFIFFAPRYCALWIAMGLLMRIILACQPITALDFAFWQWPRIFAVGAVNDLAFALFSLVPAYVIYALTTQHKYLKPLGWGILAIFAALCVYAFFVPDNVFAQHSRGLQRAVRIVSVLLLIGFAVRLFWPGLRRPWRVAVLMATMFIYVLFAVFDMLGEYFFWAEFGVRYNFVAVDYLVYTNEVVGNISESYPVVPLFLGVAVIAAGLFWLLIRGHRFGDARCPYFLKTTLIYVPAVFVSVLWLHFAYWNLKSDNAFVTELQENGCWDFIEAFRSNEIDYAKFYPMLPEKKCIELRNELCPVATDSISPDRRNIVLIMVESLSASYLTDYGKTDNLTPFVDSLMRHSLVFDSLYAAGNRSVRGLEAVTLCIPPSAGESLIKRPEQPLRTSVGSVLRDQGYRTMFVYGGNSYFDNMGTFFGANGYDVIDRKDFADGEVTFENIWGACDGDTYRMALRNFDRQAATGQPFYAHIMTISNHRPFTYPDIAELRGLTEPNSRSAGVRYTDYALQQFFAEAARRPWFDNTVFVIVADHCASSAGKTSLPLDKYHIPAIVYAPGFIAPQRIGTVCSQIDLMPTVLAKLHIPASHKFAGRDILSRGYASRAFIATYQDLAYYKDGLLTVLSPVRQVRQFDVTPTADEYIQTPVQNPDTTLRRQAQAMYQWVNILYK